MLPITITIPSSVKSFGKYVFDESMQLSESIINNILYENNLDYNTILKIEKI